jgi:hypothetical protein
MRTRPTRIHSRMEFEPGTSRIRGTDANHSTCTPCQILWKFGSCALLSEDPYLITFSYLRPVLRSGLPPIQLFTTACIIPCPVKKTEINRRRDPLR